MNTLSIISFLAAIFVGIFTTCALSESPKTGGQCDYKSYNGQAEITSINRIEKSPNGSPEAYEIKFTFIPDQEIEEEFARTGGKEFLLLLNNSSYPDIKFLEKYGISAGKLFKCSLKVITKGTCTPIIFEFPSINLSDYIKK